MPEERGKYVVEHSPTPRELYDGGSKAASMVWMAWRMVRFARESAPGLIGADDEERCIAVLRPLYDRILDDVRGLWPEEAQDDDDRGS
jgi:hypothetical protein